MSFTVVLLGVGSGFTVAGFFAMLVAGAVLTESVGFGLLAVPVVGVVTTFISLFYVYRNQPLGWSGMVWVVALVLFWFVLLPVFWYFKVNGSTHANTT